MPSKWDRMFYDVCVAVSKNSKCLSRQIGAVLVRDKTIIGCGYNGPPRGIPHCETRYFGDSYFMSRFDVLPEKNKKDIDERKYRVCPRQALGYKSGQGLELCIAGHAERNTLINAAREGVKTKGAIMYMSCGLPCTPCMIEISNAGIVEIVCENLTAYDPMVKHLIENSNLQVRMFDFLEPQEFKWVD